jgi:hypothetical protein
VTFRYIWFILDIGVFAARDLWGNGSGSDRTEKDCVMRCLAENEKKVEQEVGRPKE